MKWKEHWDTYPNKFAKDEFLKQVGKTVQGQPITTVQLDILLSGLIQKLDLNQDDLVLDLCCGNGLITSAVAKECRSVIGIDFSRALIDIARKYHGDINTSYLNLSVLDITSENMQISQPFTKIYMYEALQYFQEDQLAQLLKILLAFSSEEVIILFASVPDESRLWEFYNTFERRCEYDLRKTNGIEAIGTWWKKEMILKVCGFYGLQCKFFRQPQSLHTAHYRFDVRIKR